MFRKVINVEANILQKWLTSINKNNFVCLSTLPDSNEKFDQEIGSLYPPVKPTFPAGKWKSINAESAWKIHDYSHTVLQIPKAKERLEFLAGEEAKTLWLVEALSPRPNNLTFQKIITKTRLIENYPTLTDVKDSLRYSMPLIVECFNNEFNKIHHGSNKVIKLNNLNTENQKLHNFFCSAIKLIVSLLSHTTCHLQKCEIDENVRVESFWRVAGFEGERKCADGSWDLVKNNKNLDGGILQFQYKHKADLQIRTELPLNQIFPLDDVMCYVNSTNDYQPLYAPDMVGIKCLKERPINVSGHWIGSPCEWTTCSVHVMPDEFVDKFQTYGNKYLTEAEELMALTTMFGSCVAQAHNQGFCDVLDVTYPITTQCIIANKHHVRFGCYQLNTLQLWNDANPLQNLMWISKPINIFDEIQDIKEGSFDKDLVNFDKKLLNRTFAELLLQTILHEPQDRGYSMRPYLPDEESPLKTKYAMNFKGEKPFEHPVIGRWQYPKYSIYF